jgi:hypothetical protein
MRSIPDVTDRMDACEYCVHCGGAFDSDELDKTGSCKDCTEEPTMKDKITAILNLFPEVLWDRWSGDTESACLVFGWVERPQDDLHDYVQLIFDEGEVRSISTSSARYSHEFARRLGGGETHHNCRRVEHDFPLVNSIKLNDE